MPRSVGFKGYLLGLLLVAAVVTSCDSGDKPSSGTSGSAGDTSQASGGADVADSGSTGDGAVAGSEASAGGSPTGTAGAGGEASGSPPAALPLADAWPEFRFRCQDLALAGDSLVVVQDEYRAPDHYRVVRLVELSTGHFRDGVGIDELVKLEDGSRTGLHVAARGDVIVVAGKHQDAEDRKAYELWLMDAGTLEIRTRVSVEHNTHPDQVVLDAEYVYVAEDNSMARRFRLPDLVEDETIGSRESGIIYATRVALDGDRLFLSGSGLGQAQVIRALLDGGNSPGWATNSQYVFRDQGAHYPWSMFVAEDSLFVAGIAKQGRAQLLRFSTDDGTVLVDQVVDGPFEGYDLHAAVNSSAFFYNRDHVERGDELVRTTLDDFHELVVGKGPPDPLGLVADEGFVYVCSLRGLHRFDANTLELAGL